jgi:hypothetical protein
MANNKNVVEDALFQIRNLEETLQENAKGILQSTMTEEIRQLVKESLKEQEDEVENDEVDVDDQDMMADDQMAMDDDDDAAVADDDFADDDFSDEDDSDDDETIDMTGASDEEVLKVFKAMGDEDGIIVKKEGGNIHLQDGDDEYMIQLGESEEEEGTIYEIEMDEEEDEFVGLEDEISEFNWGGAAMGAIKGGFDLDEEETVYEIELDDMGDMMGMGSKKDNFYEEFDSMEEGMDMYTDSMEEGMDMYTDSMEEGMDMYTDSLEEDLYESIKKSRKPKGVGMGKGPRFSYDKKPNMGGGFNEKRKEAFGKGTKAMGTGKARFEYKEGENMKGQMSKVKKAETKEASRTLGNGSKDGSRGLRKARTNNRNMSFNPFKLHETESNGEINLLREKNEEYRKALDVFRTKLNEVAVFNSNLAYATRLFTEHSTTKQEKINILKRFDNVESLKESKNLYRTIKSELNSGSASETKLNESIERTVNRTVETGSSVNLIESKTYENPQFLRMKDLMSKI